MIDETLRRRGTFQPGMRIRLADLQPWSFPLAGEVAEFLTDARRGEYLGLLRVHAEAEDRSEQRLAELALALFLIGLNYELEAAELEGLFTFAAGSPGLAEAQAGFHALAREHLRRFHGEAADFRAAHAAAGAEPKPLSRALAWLRSAVSSSRRFLGSPTGGAPLGS